TFTLLGNAAIPSIVETSGKIRTLPSGKSWTIRWSGTRDLEGINSLLSLKVGKSTTKYKYGQIQVKLVKSALLGYRIEVTNSVRLHDEYLWGIGEMPSSWPLAALQAQVIASRTYALNKAGKIKSACDCDLYAATADQSFVGYSKEAEARYGAIWKSVVTSTSIDDSHGVAILYHDLPIAAYFFSSSGGQTESAIDAWGSYVPYAIGVADPWSLQINLNARYVSWIRPVSQEVVAGAFSLDDVIRLEISNRHQSGTVASITATSSKGKKSVLTGEAFRSKAKLPSTWFDFEIPQISEATPAPTDTATSNL
ncbi:MAG: SpoIID/LytB domain-containing protein, partial [Actinobacteria bacterium]|nr:SpoIID/LytB domain-containing protein [Actinomycetota bacterium]